MEGGKMKRVGIAALLTASSVLLAAQQDSQSMIAAIKAEGLRSTEATVLFHTLTDMIGPRLTGSPAHVQAAHWAAERLKAWGLDNPRLEPFQFGRGWSLEKLTVEMTAPRYMPLIGYAEAWSPPTSGVLTGTPVYLGDSTAADIDRLGPRLRGAIVLMHRPQTEFLRSDRPQPSEGNGPVQTGSLPLPGPSSSTSTFGMLTQLHALGAGAALSPGAMEHGTVRVQGFPGTARDAVPTMVLAAEHYNMLVRMVEAGASPQLRIEVGARSYENDLDSYNVLAEIPGTDAMLRDEVVLVGAHLDSWHTATGATDNADGVTAVMEAMRILTAVHARPRRTIRVALWGGEEQGLLGARAYVEQHLRDGASRRPDIRLLHGEQRAGETNLRCVARAVAGYRSAAQRDRRHRRHGPRAVRSGGHSGVHRDQGLSELRCSHPPHQCRSGRCREGRGPPAGCRLHGRHDVAGRHARRTHPSPEALRTRPRIIALICVIERLFYSSPASGSQAGDGTKTKSIVGGRILRRVQIPERYGITPAALKVSREAGRAR
jgi:hypothetical protein